MCQLDNSKITPVLYVKLTMLCLPYMLQPFAPSITPCYLCHFQARQACTGGLEPKRNNNATSSRSQWFCLLRAVARMFSPLLTSSGSIESPTSRRRTSIFEQTSLLRRRHQLFVRNPSWGLGARKYLIVLETTSSMVNTATPPPPQTPLVSIDKRC